MTWFLVILPIASWEISRILLEAKKIPKQSGAPCPHAYLHELHWVPHFLSGDHQFPCSFNIKNLKLYTWYKYTLIHSKSEMDFVRKYGPITLIQSCLAKPRSDKTEIKMTITNISKKFILNIFHSKVLLKILKDNKGNKIRQNNTTYSSSVSPAAIMLKIAGHPSCGQPSYWWAQVRKLKATLCEHLNVAWHTFYQSVSA